MSFNFKKAKMIFLAAIGLGVDKVVTDVIENVVPAQTKPIARIFTKLGTLALSFFVASKVTDGISKDIDKIEETVTDAVKEIEESVKEEAEEA